MAEADALVTEGLLVLREAERYAHALESACWRRKQSLHQRLSNEVTLVAALVVHLTGDLDAGVTYLNWHLQRPCSQTLSDHVDHTLISTITEEWKHEVDFLSAIADIDDAFRYQAERWIAEYKLFPYLAGANTKGIMFSSPKIIQVYLSLWPIASLGTIATAFINRLKDSQKAREKFLHLWRKRWNIVYKKLPPRAAVPLKVLQQRVWCLTRLCRLLHVIVFVASAYSIQTCSSKVPSSSCSPSSCLVRAIQLQRHFKVWLFLCWTQWLLRNMLGKERVVVVNMDETALAMNSYGRRGNVYCISKNTPHRLYENVDLKDMRGSCTLIASITNCPEFQKVLPQILLPKSNKQDVPKKSLEAYEALPDPIETWTGSSGWTNGQLIREYITTMRRAINKVDKRYHIVLLMDDASQHVADEVLAHANRLNVKLLIVPAKCTWLLQPLDTHVFVEFKRLIHRAFLDHRLESDNGVLTPVDWIRLIGECIQSSLVNKDWSFTFPKVGVAKDLLGLRRSVTALIQDLPPVVPKELTKAELETVLNRTNSRFDDQLLAGPSRVAASTPVVSATVSSRPLTRTASGALPQPATKAHRK